MLAVIEQAAPEGRIALAGFSFGAFVTAQAVTRLWADRPPERIVLVGTAAARFEVATLPPDSHERTLVLHGEQDETVPLAAALDWARPQSLPVTVVPGVEHFFHGKLPLLKSLVLRHLR
jgi:alpha/beta superfamily hydrolase